MYASIPDALRALARKIGADANGRNEEEILNNIVVKLGGTPVTNHGVAGSIDAMTKVVDLDIMHNLTTLSVTPTTSAQSITPESPVDGYSSVSVSAVTSAIDQNIVAGNIKKDVEILGVTGSYEGSGAETFAVTITGQGEPGSYTFSANKTYSETMTAIQNGDAVSFVVIANGQSINACGYFLMANAVDNSIVVVIAAEDTSVQYASCIKWTSGNTLEVLDLIPANG